MLQTRREFDKQVNELKARLEGSIQYRLLELSNRVNELARRRGFRRPQDILRQQRQRSDDLAARLAAGLRGRLESSRKRYTKAHLGVASFDLRAKLSELRLQLQSQNSELAKGLQARLEISRKRFSKAHLGVASFDFRAKIAALGLLLERQSVELAKRAERIVRMKRERWERFSLQLQERSPLKVLERGYAIASDAAGNVLRDADQVSIGDRVTIQLHRGRLNAEVKQKES